MKRGHRPINLRFRKFQPEKVAEAYMKEHPGTKISISDGGSGNGIKAIVDSTTDIADSSRFIKAKEVKLAVENGVYPVPFSVAYDYRALHLDFSTAKVSWVLGGRFCQKNSL